MAAARTSTRWIQRLICATILVPACGQYVSYDGEEPQAEAVREVAPLPDYPEADRIGHYALAGLIARFAREVEGQGGTDVVIDYDAWHQDEEARYQLDTYLATLAGVDPQTLADAPERRALWINAYNAGVIAGVLRRAEGEFDTFSVIEDEGFFSERAVTVGGVTLSLDQVEHGVLRGALQEDRVSAGLSQEERDTIARWHEQAWSDREGSVDARLHAALNCGALGCPNLLVGGAGVYVGDQLDGQLAAQTRAWLAHSGKGAGSDGISNLFEWFAQDFIDDAGSVEAFISAHRDGGAQGVDTTTIIPYDWTLNRTGVD